VTIATAHVHRVFSSDSATPVAMIVAWIVLISIGAALGLWYGFRLLRRHVHAGFWFLHLVHRNEQRPLTGEDIRVAFDVKKSQERNRKMSEWSGGGGK
jgi:hypothetical protein